MSAGKLLLVDDDAVFRDRLARALTARGMVVETAAGSPPRRLVRRSDRVERVDAADAERILALLADVG